MGTSGTSFCWWFQLPRHSHWVGINHPIFELFHPSIVTSGSEKDMDSMEKSIKKKYLSTFSKAKLVADHADQGTSSKIWASSLLSSTTPWVVKPIIAPFATITRPKKMSIRWYFESSASGERGVEESDSRWILEVRGTKSKWAVRKIQIMQKPELKIETNNNLVGGFNPSEKY